MGFSPAQAASDGTYTANWLDYKKTLGDQKITWNIISDSMDLVLDAANYKFAQGDAQGAYKAINDCYYGYYEVTGFEKTAMGYIGNGRKSEVELQFSNCKSVCKKGGTTDELKAQTDTLSEMLHTDADKLDGTSGDEGSTGAVATFVACFSILLREGIEAILVIGAIIAYLVKSGNKKSLKSVYLGAILGVACSFLAAWLLDALKLSNAAPQEIIEGVTALVAVVVLYWVSNWMLSKSESKAWTKYIEGKVASSVDTGSTFALAFTAWLAVFREGAEVILFYQPLLSGGNMGAVWAGFGVGCVAIAIVFVLMRFFSVRLPLKPFFLTMSILMFIMSIAFLGAGIKELIEGDIIGATSPAWLQWIPYTDFLDMLGIYPVLETLIPQLILLIITIIIFVITTRKNRAIHAEAEARRAAERAVQEAQEKAERESALTGYITNVVNDILVQRGLIPPLSEEEKQALADQVQSITDEAGDVIANAGDIAKA